jgi:prostatic aicd phosphatase
MLPSVTEALNNIANSSNPLKFMYSAISYKPFLSFFNMTGIAQQNPELEGIVNYAGAVALELWGTGDNSSEPVLRFNFKNGTDDPDFKTYNFMNASGDVPLSTFVNYLAVSTLFFLAEPEC